MDNLSMQVEPNQIFLLKLSRVSTQTLIKCTLLSLRNAPLLFSKTHK
jgi:hypothetical protein